METHQQRRYRAAYDSIIRVCGQGLPGDDLFTRLSGQLRKAVAFRTAGWLRLDPMTLLPMPGLMLQADHDRVSRIIHNEYFEPDVMKFRELARARVPAQSLWQATDGQPHRSTRYRIIYGDLGYGDDLRMVFRCGSAVWGAGCLARAAADPPFTRDEVFFVARVCAPVARGLRLSHLLAVGHPADPAPPGVLIIGDDDGIISLTEAARHWLAQLPPRSRPRPAPARRGPQRRQPGTRAGCRTARDRHPRRAHPHIGGKLAAPARRPADT